MYQITTTLLQDEQTPVEPVPQYSPTIASTVCDATSWQVLHSLVFPILKNWSSQHTTNHIAVAWRDAINQGLQHDTTWDQLQQIMHFDDFNEYYYYISNCTPITHHTIH
jgi:hypothetical protein